MQIEGYTKLFSSIVASTVWREPHTVRIVWITMLAMANKTGFVAASLPGLADLSRVTIPECKEALAALSAPDEYSRTPDNEGRRIEPREGGWAILNHAKYRAKMSDDQRREYLRQKQAEHRARKRQHDVNSKGDKSTESTHAEAKADTKAEAGTNPNPLPPAGPAPRGAGGISEGGKSDMLPTTEQSKRIATIFHRKLTTPWTAKEKRAYRAIGTVPEEDLQALEAYYGAHWPPKRELNILRHDLLTFLNNFPGEVDRARNFKTHPTAHATSKTTSHRTAADREIDRTGVIPAPIRTPEI